MIGRSNIFMNSSHVRGIGTNSSHVRGIGTNSSHPRKSCISSSRVWRILTNSSHVRNYQQRSLSIKFRLNWPYVNFTFFKCDVLVPTLLMGVKFTKWEIYGSTGLWNTYLTYQIRRTATYVYVETHKMLFRSICSGDWNICAEYDLRGWLPLTGALTLTGTKKPTVRCLITRPDYPLWEH